MSYFDAIFLGILQGLTEFLPVSSSGHLVLAEHILHAKNPGVAFELVVHLGTLLSVLIYFRRRIVLLLGSFFKKTETDTRRMNYLLLVATIPAVIAGVFFKDFFESAFSAPVMTSIFLMVTGLILLLTALVPKKDNPVTLGRSIIIGIGQAIAILPGISRSGSTISAGLFAGVNPVAAAEFSFLLSIPTIAGAIVFKIKDIIDINTALYGQFFVGLLASFIFGLLSVYWLLDIIKKGKFKYFGIYCLIVGLFGFIYFTR